MVKQTMIAAVMASTALLGACATTTDSVATAGPKSTAASAPGVSIAEGALAGAAVAGITNAVWADQNNDGYVDGYVQNGAYYPGVPQGYDPVLRRVVGSAADVAVPAPVAAPTMPVTTNPPSAVPVANGMPSGAMPATTAPATTAPAKTPAPATATPPPARGERG